MKVDCCKIVRCKEGIVKAFVDIRINDEVIVTGFRVVQGKDGLFAGLPRERDKKGAWHATFIPLSMEIKNKINEVIIKAYKEER